MFGEVVRVISGDDVRDMQQQQLQHYQVQLLNSSSNDNNNIQSINNQNDDAMMIEPDPDHSEGSDHRAPLNLIAPDRDASDNFTTSSSLSDASHEGDAKLEEMDAHPPPADVFMEDTPLASRASATWQEHPATTHYQQQLQQKHRGQRLPRMDSSDGSDSGSARATTNSQNSNRDWGWFEDVHQSGQLTPTGSLTKGHFSSGGGDRRSRQKPSMHRMVVGLDPRDETAAAAMAVTAPTYVLEESMSSQRLWKDTAGNRPPQPVEERAFFEKMWAQNFAVSKVNYEMPVEVLTATSPISLNPFAEGGAMEISAAAAAGDGGNFQQYNMNVNTPANTYTMMMMPSSNKGGEGELEVEPEKSGGGLKQVPRLAPPTFLPPLNHQHIVNKTAKTESGDNLTVLVRGDNVFGTTVSKSFACSDEKGGPITGVDTVNISIASYRVVESHKHGKYAQFLVIYREGNIRDTIGVWKRYSDFHDLANKVTQAHEGCASVIATMSPLTVVSETDPEVEHLPNAITSWRLLKKRKRWYRCLDAGYLSLKVFLLERFLHDILFESSSPKLLREFIGSDEYLSR